MWQKIYAWGGRFVRNWRARRTRGSVRVVLASLLQGRQGELHLLDVHVSNFFPCRPAISCSSSHPFRTSQAIRPVSASSCNLYTTSVRTMPSSAEPHVKSRCPQYPGSQVKRFPVPDDKVDWSQDWPQYNPVSYTDPSVVKKPAWADPEIGWATHALIYTKIFLIFWPLHMCFSKISCSLYMEILLTSACFSALSLQSSTLWMEVWTGQALMAATKTKKESHCKLLSTKRNVFYKRFPDIYVTLVRNTGLFFLKILQKEVTVTSLYILANTFLMLLSLPGMLFLESICCISNPFPLQRVISLNVNITDIYLWSFHTNAQTGCPKQGCEHFWKVKSLTGRSTMLFVFFVVVHVHFNI